MDVDRVVLETEQTSVVQDQGVFTAVAAAYSVDRVNDRIIPGAFEKTIKAWQDSGKNIPLHWDHQGEPEDIIGVVDPSTMRETDAGLEVTGQVDLENSTKGREAWRAIKSGSMSLSFGYIATKQEKAADGVNDLQEIDLFEVSVVPGPANADTHFISLKSLEPGLRETIEGLQKRVTQLEKDLKQFKTEDEDRKDEEPTRPTPTRQDPLAAQIEDLWLAAATTGGSNADSQRTHPA